jgi:hypothetical protein
MFSLSLLDGYHTLNSHSPLRPEAGDREVVSTSEVLPGRSPPEVCSCFLVLPDSRSIFLLPGRLLGGYSRFPKKHFCQPWMNGPWRNSISFLFVGRELEQEENKEKRLVFTIAFL